jgi:hypothetical protein
VLKDVMLLAGGLLIMADSARAFLEARPYAKLRTMTASKTCIARPSERSRLPPEPAASETVWNKLRKTTSKEPVA